MIHSLLPPKLLCNGVLRGRPLWNTPDRFRCTGVLDAGTDNEEWNPDLVYGRVNFSLLIDSPTSCDISSKTASFFLGTKPETTNGLAILTLCWSYIRSTICPIP